MYFEEFAVDSEYTTSLRKVTEADVKAFLDLSLLKNPIFSYDQAAQAMGHPKRILPAPLLISLAMGLCQQQGLVRPYGGRARIRLCQVPATQLSGRCRPGKKPCGPCRPDQKRPAGSSRD